MLDSLCLSLVLAGLPQVTGAAQSPRTPPRDAATTDKKGTAIIKGKVTAADTGRPLPIADGQTLDRIDFAMPRMGVIAGRVTDEVADAALDVQNGQKLNVTIVVSDRMSSVRGLVRDEKLQAASGTVILFPEDA
jgi:hypothetical protein